MKCVGTPISPSCHEQILGDAVVEDALAVDVVVLLVVEGGGVVLEILDRACPARGPHRGSWPCLRRRAGGGSCLVPSLTTGLTADKRQSVGERLNEAARHVQIAIAGIDSRGLAATLAYGEWAYNDWWDAGGLAPQSVDFRRISALSLGASGTEFPQDFRASIPESRGARGGDTPNDEFRGSREGFRAEIRP